MSEEKKVSEKGLKKRTPSAQKRDLQNERKKHHNHGLKAKVKTAIRAFEDSVTAGNKADAKKHLNLVYSLMDKGVKTNLFKMNKASRAKSRLSARVAK
ncbi:MAG: 30S ribosomal protein S20 [Rhabdochlamydiaceae bacterium]|jgi:small subunit ribosomal protein S20